MTDVQIMHYAFRENISSVDIMLWEYGLCIMVDGEHHFAAKKPRRNKRRGSKRSKVSEELLQSAKDQQDKDRVFNHRVLSDKKNFNILRLHFDDAGLYKQIVFLACKACKKGVVKNRIMFSKSFPEATRLEYGDKYLAMT